MPPFPPALMAAVYLLLGPTLAAGYVLCPIAIAFYGVMSAMLPWLEERLGIGARAKQHPQAPTSTGLVGEGVRAMCRLRSVFLSRGVAVNDGVYNPKGRVKWLAKLTPPHRRLAEWLGRQLDQLVPLREQAEKWLIEEAKTHPIIRKLATAPGMGPIRTAQVVAITANPHRFRTRRQYWSYCGFGIVTRSSSDWVQGKDGRWERSQVHQTRGLTRKRHPLLKAVFKGAATTVITQLPDHPLHKDYERMLVAGIKPNLAKLTLARKIAATVLSMWKHQEVYDPHRHQAVSDKA